MVTPSPVAWSTGGPVSGPVSQAEESDRLARPRSRRAFLGAVLVALVLLFGAPRCAGRCCGGGAVLPLGAGLPLPFLMSRGRARGADVAARIGDTTLGVAW